jgi:heme/copper-type cytochrome/quinol oxidase subunit 2
MRMPKTGAVIETLSKGEYACGYVGHYRPTWANDSENGAAEWAYGVTPWFEQGLYLPVYSLYSTNHGTTINGFKIRELFVRPNAHDHTFFYGVNFEFRPKGEPVKHLKIGLSVLLLAFALPLFLAGVRAPQAPAQLVQIHMTAKKYTFDPDVIAVKQGNRVQLIVTATDRDHGIAIPAFGVKQYLKKGVPVTVNFTASKAGTFPFHCSVFCGLGHRHMKGKLIVKPD